MNIQSNKIPAKGGIQKLRSTLNTFGNREKKANPQTTLNSSYAEIKRKRHQPTNANTQSNIDRYEIQSSNLSKNTHEVKTNIILLEKDSTVNFQEEVLHASKKTKIMQDKAKLNVTKTKYIQPNKQSTYQRETLKLPKKKQEQKLKQICDQQRAHCSIRSNIYSFQLNGDIIKTQSNQAKQLQYQEMGRKLNEMIQENKQLKCKLQKLKISNMESRRSLKDQVINFNTQGGQAKKTKQTLEHLQIQNIKLLEELNKITNQSSNHARRIEQITAEKQKLETQNELQHKNLCQLKQMYLILKQKYEEQTINLEKNQQQINQHSEIMSLQIESKLNTSSAQLDQLTDMTINSQLKEDDVHLKYILNEDTDTLQLWRGMEEKYLGLITELKNRLLDCEMQNFQLQAEIQQLKHSTNNYESQKMDLNIQTQILLLLMENNRLKIKEYEVKEEIKEIKETLKLSELQSKQLRVEKESKKEQLTATLIHLNKIQYSDQKLRQEYHSLKVQLRESEQMVRKLKVQKQQDLLAKASIVRKIKCFK